MIIFAFIITILIVAWIGIFSVCYVHLDINGFLSFIIATIPFIALGSLVIKKSKENEKKKQQLFDNFDEQTKDTISKAWKNLQNKSILTPKFMDENNILMILSYDFERYNLKKCVLKDKKTNTICLFNLLSNEHNNIRFEKPNFRITQLANTEYKYNEERLVYTSATVGFVTTGGFHKEGGDYSSNRSYTGKYGITEFDSIDNDYKKLLILNEVYLNSSLTKKAQNSNMKKYITKDNHLYLLHAMSQLTRETLNYASSAVCGNYSQFGAYNSLQNKAKTEMALTKTECIQIKDWLLSNMI